MASFITWARSRPFSTSVQALRVVTGDGIELAGSRLGAADPAVVLCHGFTGWHRKARYVVLAEGLARQFTVYGFDFRGHGASGGTSSYGNLEIRDVEAVVRRAREEGHQRVATVGASMGGIAALRHAGLLGGVDAVVTVSAPARWDGHRSAAVQRVAWLTGTARGRRMARVIGVRLPGFWDRPESPEDVVGKIAPTPLLVVHGHDDTFFDEEEAWRLYRRAGEPKSLWLAPRFGHAEDGFTPAFAERIGRWIYGVWGLAWPG
jgi:pimeloyl-ACP methyl ester carboxylesterase